MTFTKRISIIIISALAGTSSAYILNFLILHNILIPDPCYYHTNDTNETFDIFYQLSASEGYHPFPTTFNFILTAAIGAIIGITFALIKLKRAKSSILDSESN